MSLSARVAAALHGLVLPRAAPESRSWFQSAWTDLGSADGLARFGAHYSGAGRRLGRAPVESTTAEDEALRAAGMDPLPKAWGLDECGRGAFLLRAIGACDPGERRERVADTYTRGEVRERQAVLRVLAYLPDPASHCDLAVEACRSSVQSVFEAICCDNPYPSAFFPEASFNQMTLKAIFTGVPLGRVHGLERRVTLELVRMAADYAAERRAAGRDVPSDVSLILGAARTA